MKITNVRRNLVVLKYTLLRGYAWCQLPAMSIIGAGVIKPYLPLPMWLIAIIAFVIMVSVGFLDRKLKLLHEEQSYSTETNPMLMAGLRGELNKPKEPKDI